MNFWLLTFFSFFDIPCNLPENKKQIIINTLIWWNLSKECKTAIIWNYSMIFCISTYKQTRYETIHRLRPQKDWVGGFRKWQSAWWMGQKNTKMCWRIIWMTPKILTQRMPLAANLRLALGLTLMRRCTCAIIRIESIFFHSIENKSTYQAYPVYVYYGNSDGPQLCTLCCISLRRCCFGLETRVMITA